LCQALCRLSPSRPANVCERTEGYVQHRWTRTQTPAVCAHPLPSMAPETSETNCRLPGITDPTAGITDMSGWKHRTASTTSLWIWRACCIPQTLLCYERNGAALSQEHGAPLRLVVPVKYGVKNLKRIGAIRYSRLRPPD